MRAYGASAPSNYVSDYMTLRNLAKKSRLTFLGDQKQVAIVSRRKAGGFGCQAAWQRDKDQCGQATKGVWGMSRRQEAMKGVEDCEKSGEAVKQALIPEFPSQPGELKHLSTRRNRK